MLTLALLKIIGSAGCIGIGMWASQKTTAKVDEWLVLREIRRNNGNLKGL